MSDFFKQARDAAETALNRATAAGRAVAEQVSQVTGTAAKSTIYVEFKTVEDMASARAAITALNGQDCAVVQGIDTAMVIKVQRPERSDAMLRAIDSFHPTVLLSL